MTPPTTARSPPVAGPAALLVAKLHKLGERRGHPTRLLDKDAHDIYRLIVGISTGELARSLRRLLTDDLSAQVTRRAMEHLADMLLIGPEGVGSQMAGRAEILVGDPDTVARSVAILALDLIADLGGS